jgi:DNA-binding GntR family transcriptional regulator
MATRKAPAGIARATRRTAPAAGAPVPVDANLTLTEQAYAALEELIVHGKLAPGELVSEAMLAEKLAIGRTPIREALQRLAREHLVSIQPRRSVTIAPIDLRGQLRMLELRRAVEALVVASAARRRNADECARFEALAEEFERSAKARDDVRFMRVDREFNELCIRAARNEFAAASMQSIAPLARRFWIQYSPKAGDVLIVGRLHASLSRAIGEGKVREALRALTALLDQIEVFTKATATADF